MQYSIFSLSEELYLTLDALPCSSVTSSSDDTAVNIILSHHFNRYGLRQISLQKKINSLTSFLNSLLFAVYLQGKTP